MDGLTLIYLGALYSVISLCACIGYYLRRSGELPESFMSMAYRCKKKWLWTLWLWSTTFTLTPALFEVMPESWHGVAHAYATSMLLLGVIPFVKHEYKGECNRAFSLLGMCACLFSQLCVAILCPYVLLVWIPLWIPFSTLCLAALLGYNECPDSLSLFGGKGLFYFESVCYVSLFASVIINMCWHG